jgi:hypothetical protein
MGSITNSTISNNTAIPIANTAAGGAFVFGVTLNNSTVSGNTVIADELNQNGPYAYYLGAAAGVLVLGPGTKIDHSTIAFNQLTGAPPLPGQVSGGVTGLDFSAFGQTFIADVDVHDTIIAKNAATANDPDVTGSFASEGHNLIGVLTATATGFVASDLHGTASAPLDPRLGKLKINGGPTMTHALRHDSPAVNAGDNANAPPTDQRGAARIAGGTIDIGAYEVQHPSHDGDEDGDGNDSFNPPNAGTGGIPDLHSAIAAKPRTFRFAAWTQMRLPNSKADAWRELSRLLDGGPPGHPSTSDTSSDSTPIRAIVCVAATDEAAGP